MIPLTIAVALIAVALALWVKPPTALGILICSMMLYPDYLRVPVGPPASSGVASCIAQFDMVGTHR